MDEHFAKIKERYQIYHDDLLKDGKLPAKDTGVGFWGVSVLDELYELFKKIDLGQHSSFVDLGSGDGRVAILASLFCEKAHGVEYDRELYSASNHIKKILSASVPDVKRSEFFHGDYFKHDIADYDVVFINPDKPFHRGLDRKMISELNGGLVIYGPHFHPHALERQDVHDVGTMVSLYRNPISEKKFSFQLSSCK